MKVLLLGGTGQLGSDLLRSAPEGFEIHAPSRSELEVCDSARLAAAIARLSPNLILNTTAFHDLPRCEAEPLRAFEANCVAVEGLARAAKKIGARFVTYSTDYVFDGGQSTPYTEEATPAPLQMYGISKLAGELAARSVWADGTWVIRTCGLYGVQGSRARQGNFVDKRVADSRSSGPLQISSEQTVSPTSTSDLSAATWKLLAQPRALPGIYHLVNEGQCSWYELTREIFRLVGSGRELRPVDRGGASGEMRRPTYSALANQKGRALDVVLPSWKDALARYLATKAS